jgi:uncharacterized membrane protein YeiH
VYEKQSVGYLLEYKKTTFIVRCTTNVRQTYYSTEVALLCNILNCVDIVILDLIGVFAFSMSGAAKAIRQRYNVSGIILCAFLTALAGGTIREMILGRIPYYFYDYSYIIVVILSAFITILAWRWFTKFEKYLVAADAVGLAAFAYIGANAAWTAHAGVGAIIGFAILTAAGGGIIADMVAGVKPAALHRDFYIPPAALLGLGFAVFGETAQFAPAAYLLIGATVVVRLSWLQVKKHKRKIKNRLLLPLLRNMRFGAIFGQD